MATGSVLAALGCLGLALSHSLPAYFAAWLVLGIAMRLTLYDAAFAALARVGGADARRAMAQITLPGGLSSTAFWPLGTALADSLGWRGAVLVYAGLMLATAPLALALPAIRHRDRPTSGAEGPQSKSGGAGSGLLLAGVLYALITTVMNFLNAGMSSHMIAILAGLGLAQTSAVWVATLRGIGQSAARLAEILFGTRLHPLALNLLACSLLPLSFAAGFAGGYSLTAAMLFALGYGAGNGLATIYTRHGATRSVRPSRLWRRHRPLAGAELCRFGRGARHLCPRDRLVGPGGSARTLPGAGRHHTGRGSPAQAAFCAGKRRFLWNFAGEWRSTMKSRRYRCMEQGAAGSNKSRGKRPS